MDYESTINIYVTLIYFFISKVQYTITVIKVTKSPTFYILRNVQYTDLNVTNKKEKHYNI